MKIIEGLCSRCKEHSSAVLENEDDDVISECCSAGLLSPENGFGAGLLADYEPKLPSGRGCYDKSNILGAYKGAKMEKYELIKLSNGTYKVFVYDSILCQRLNRSLGAYPKETNFVTEGSEGIFKFKEDKLKHVLAVLKT